MQPRDPAPLRMRARSAPRTVGGRRRVFGIATAVVALGGFSPHLGANPAGMTVIQGTAQAVVHGSQLQVTASHHAFLEWESFHIAAGESAVFRQPSAGSVVWNRIGGAQPTTILGRLEANGFVVLANESGFYFGPDAFVKAAGLLVTTAPIVPPVSGGGPWDLRPPPTSIPIVNYGQLEVGAGGSLFLIAHQVENHGRLSAPDGAVALHAGRELRVSERPDGRGLSVRVQLPAGAVDNRGQIVADGGQILLAAQTVNQSGVVQANSIRERNGVIELVAAERVELGAGSVIRAQGEAEGVSPGGGVVIRSDGEFRDTAGSTVSVAGGAQGGDGGTVALSAPSAAGLRSTLDGRGGPGGRNGGLRLGTTDLRLDHAGLGEAQSPPLTGTLGLDVDEVFLGFSRIELEAANELRLVAGTVWDLSQSTGSDREGDALYLSAGADLRLEAGSSVVAGARAEDAGHWAVTLTAGRPAGQADVVPGVGTVRLLGDATIATAKGSIEVRAGGDVILDKGALRTTGGGDIAVRAVGGNIDTGANARGYQFTKVDPGYVPHAELGGVSTAAGGDVRLEAGGGIRTFLPPARGEGVTGNAGSGAYGAEPGDVFVSAGGEISGHFMLRNGQGTIRAGGSAGSASRPLALSLVQGRWAVEATDAIVLQEVRNPNGVFNAQSLNNPFKYRFDYAPDAAVSLKAGDAVALTGSSLPRASGATTLPPIYPPTLRIEAGGGGITLGQRVVLFPAPAGNLEVITTGGGSLRSDRAGQNRYFSLSDTERRQWNNTTDFTEADRGFNLLHRDDPVPARFEISGSVSDLTLLLPKPVLLKVGGDVRSTSVRSQHFRPTDETRLEVAGALVNRSAFTFRNLPVAEQPNFDAFVQATEAEVKGLRERFLFRVVDDQTVRLGYTDRMSSKELSALLALTVEVSQPDGTVRTGPWIAAEVLQDLYHRSQDIPATPIGGYEVSGPGRLTVQAAHLDLGVSQGVVSRGFALNPALAPLGERGVDIAVALEGNLEMFSSSIISQAGGSIDIDSRGTINVGSQEVSGNSNLPRGIVALGGGSIRVAATGDVQLNGSRIAAYDGGDITVRSREGSVDAGKGGTGHIRVSKPYYDAPSGRVLYASATIPGSGILATSYPFEVPGQPPARVGNITVEAHVDISASAGGIVQVALGPVAQRDESITLRAGRDIQAGGSGVIGGRVILEAGRSVEGLVFARQDVNISAKQNVSATVLAQGGVTLSAGGTVSGTIAGASSVNVSGDSVSAALLSQSVSASGTLSGAAAAPTGAAGNVASQKAAKTVQEADSPLVAEAGGDGKGEDEEDDPERAATLLGEWVGRVTVILP